MKDPNLEPLLILQQADMRRKGLEDRLRLVPKQLDEIISRRQALNVQIIAAGENVKTTERDIKQLEAEIARLTEESQKLQQQSAMVKKNNEYQAMLAQIAVNKKKIGELEERVIRKFDLLAENKKIAVKVQKQNTLAMRNARTEFEELLDFTNEAKAEINTAILGRGALVDNVQDEELLAAYSRLSCKRDNSPPITKLSNGCCGHCHMKVTTQTVNELSKGKIEICDNCQHLIYSDEE